MYKTEEEFLCWNLRILIENCVKQKEKLALELGYKFVDAIDLLKSGGSDYHGKNKPGIELKVGKGNLEIPRDIIKNWEKM